MERTAGPMNTGGPPGITCKHKFLSSVLPPTAVSTFSPVTPDSQCNNHLLMVAPGSDHRSYQAAWGPATPTSTSTVPHLSALLTGVLFKISFEKQGSPVQKEKSETPGTRQPANGR